VNRYRRGANRFGPRRWPADPTLAMIRTPRASWHKLSKQFQRDLPRPLLPRKTFRFRRRANQHYDSARLTADEGRVAIVTNVVVGCGGRGCCDETNATSADGEVVWFWRPDAGAKFSVIEHRWRRRWQESPVTGKSTKETVTPSRRESRNAPVEPVVLPPCFLLHGTHGCSQHPAFPAPSVFEEGET
jgi:hypothetical protein